MCAIASHIYRYKYCQSQNGSAECDLFAIAFASVKAKQEDPSCYNFNQQTMHDHHLHQCLLRVFTDFPVRRTSRKNDKVCHTFHVPIYCYCRMPDICGIKMVKCDKCESRFRVDCVRISKDQLVKKCQPWYCNDSN